LRQSPKKLWPWFTCECERRPRDSHSFKNYTSPPTSHCRSIWQYFRTSSRQLATIFSLSLSFHEHHRYFTLWI